MLKAVIYARFSSDMQREESIDAQVRACKEYAVKNGMSVVRIYADKAISGKSDKRPEFQKMIQESKLFDVVLIHKYNRFARRMKDHLIYEDKLNQNDCTLISVTEDFGQGKNSIIVKTVLQAISQYYIMDLADEVKKGHKENALKALFNGGVAPFGYDIVDLKYVINEKEAYWVQKMFDCAYRKKGFSELLKEMSAAGVVGKRGKPLQYSSVYEILRNEKYTGTYVYDPEPTKHNRRDKTNAIRIEDAIPEIVPKAIFDQVQKNRRGRKLSKNDYPLKGLVYCEECGSKMTVHFANKRNESPYFYCSNKCTGSIKMEVVEAAVKDYVNALMKPEAMEELKVYLYRYQQSQNKAVKDFNRTIEKSIIEKKAEMEKLVMKLTEVDDDLTPIVSDQIRKVRDEIAALEMQEPPQSFSPVQIDGFVNHLGTDFTNESLSVIIEKVEISKEKEVKVYSTLTSLLGDFSPNYGGDTQI